MNLKKLLSWSLILEGFLYFIILDRVVAGFSLSAARVLQATWIFLFILRYRKIVVISSVDGDVFRNKALSLFALVIFSTLVGFILGNYDISSYNSGASNQYGTNVIFLITRPLIEVLLTAYYYWLFLVVAKNQLSGAVMYEYLLRSFLILCLLSLILGFLDLFSKVIFDEALLVRHLAEYHYAEIAEIGIRFHGLAGEPRDAVSQLLLLMAVLFVLKTKFRATISAIQSWCVPVLLLAIVLCQSISGYIAIPIFAVLISIYFKKSYVSVKFILSGVVIIVGCYLFLTYSLSDKDSRILYYVNTYTGITEDLSNGSILNADQMTQILNIFPLVKLYDYCTGGNILLCLFGSGLASSGFANAQLAVEGVSFPHSQISRVMFELGLVGTVMYVSFFVALVNVSRKLTLEDCEFNQTSLMWGMAIISAVLAHRSANIWFYCTIVLLTVNLDDQEVKVWHLLLRRNWIFRLFFKIKEIDSR